MEGLKMGWFKQFINETVSKWATQGLASRRISVIANPHVGTILDEMKITTNELGDMGEDYVKNLMNIQNYLSHTTRGSRSPADVWSIKVYNNIIHIPLIQVKSTLASEKPFDIVQSDENQIKNLSIFVYDEFQTSGIVPNLHRGKPLIISYGYAGVVFNKEMEASVYKPRYIGAIYTESIGNYNGLEQGINRIHRLLL